MSKIMFDNKENIIKHFNDLASQRTYYEPRWTELAKYIAPNKKDIQYDSVPGEQKTEELFDATAIHAKNLLVAMLTGEITTASKKWFNLRFKSPNLNDDFESLAWLEEVQQITYHYVNRSNLYRELNLLYHELVDLGTGSLFIDSLTPDRNGLFGGLIFKAISLKESYLAEGKEGLIDVMYRKFKITALQAAETWGIDSLPEKIKHVYENKPFEYVTILHCVYPRNIPATEEQILLSTQKEYTSVYYSLDDKKTISESGYNFFPFAVPRWMKYPGEVYGRGPADDSLPDIKTLNKVVEMTLKWGALRMQPPLLKQKGAFLGQFTLEPRALIEVQAGIPADQAITPLNLGGDVNLESIIIADKRKQIEAAFFTDHIKAIISIEAPRRTATETQLRYDLMQQMLGPVLTNIEQELLNPLVNKMLELLARNSVFPQPPVGVMDDPEGGELVIEYESPLFRRQRINEVMALQGMYEYMSVVSPYAPDVGDGIDHDKGLKHVGKIRGVPIDMFRKEEELKAIRRGRIETEQQEQQAQEALALTQGVKNVAPMAKLMQGVQGGI